MCNCHITTIDGPSASGKSTVAKKVACNIGSLYVDSGALYRGITWRALQMRVDPSDTEAMAKLVQNSAAEFFVEQGMVRFKMDGVLLGDELRTQEINDSVSKVATLPFVREKVVSWLRSMTNFGDLVVEGRDIGTVVFKDAEHKFYLDANPAIRAQRRYAEMEAMLAKKSSSLQKSSSPSLTEVEKSLSRRDNIDSTRSTAPLRPAPGAMRIDNTRMSIEQAVEVIVSAIKASKLA